MIKRNHIRQFLAVADAGSFSQAATRLHITQPTLSAGIAELERLVGTRLFLRERRRIRLTDAGGSFLPIARDLEKSFRAADNFGADRSVSWPSLRLGVIRTIASSQLKTIIAALNTTHGMEIAEGTDYELRTALSGGRIDMALTLLRENETGFAAHPLWSEPYRLIVKADHAMATRSEVEPEELASEIMIARRSCEILEETSRYFTGMGVRPRFSLRSDNDERCLAMVAAGLGITTAPLSFVHPGTCPVPMVGYDYHRTIGFLFDARDSTANTAPPAADFVRLLPAITL